MAAVLHVLPLATFTVQDTLNFQRSTLHAITPHYMPMQVAPLDTLSFNVPRHMPMQVAPLDTAELLGGGWQDGCLLLVMPGGADLPYCKHLNGRGNQLIRGEQERLSGAGAMHGPRASRAQSEHASVTSTAASDLGLAPGLRTLLLHSVQNTLRVEARTSASVLERTMPAREWNSSRGAGGQGRAAGLALQCGSRGTPTCRADARLACSGTSDPCRHAACPPASPAYFAG